MATIEKIQRQKAEIDKQIEEATKEQNKEELNLVRKLCKRHGLTYNMLKNHLSEGRKSK